MKGRGREEDEEEQWVDGREQRACESDRSVSSREMKVMERRERRGANSRGLAQRGAERSPLSLSSSHSSLSLLSGY
jgi:hypothetical protein